LVWRFVPANATFTGAHPSQTNDPMQTTPPQIDPERPRDQPETAPDSSDSMISTPETPQPGAPISVVPHEGATRTIVAPVHIIRTNRFGHLEEHELIKLLDTIEDERARGRFRESIYISLFVWLAIAWLAFYGPKYLWHAPQLITPADALHQQQVVQLNAPVLPHHAFAPPPKIDRGTLAKLRAMEPKPSAAPPAPTPTPRPLAAAEPTPPPIATQPVPPTPSPRLPLPSAPTPVARSTEPDAPTPQPSTRPTFNTGRSASDDLQQAMHGSQSAGDDRSVGIKGSNRGTGVGSGAEILSDTQGVDFQPYLGRIIHLIYQQWIPLLPEEARPPLNKQGATLIRFTINPDGTVAAMHLDGSTHDVALDKAAWGSITGVGQFPPLPKQFHGPNLELRIHYSVNQDTEQ
jgi:TonB family protein